MLRVKLKKQKGHSKSYLKQLAKRQARFLVKYKQCGHQGDTCRAIGISIDAVWDWRKGKAFNDLFENARAGVAQIYEDEAKRRAVTGVEQDVYFEGRVVGKRTEYSDMLLKTLLQANDKRYRQNIPIGDGTGDNSFSIVLQRAPADGDRKPDKT